jgi:hypothetical protein
MQAPPTGALKIGLSTKGALILHLGRERHLLKPCLYRVD